MTATFEQPSQTAETPDVEVPRAWRWRGCLVAAAVPTLLTGLHAAWYGQWIVDDAGLTFAFARSLVTGAGPVVQAGAEPVEGYSSPTWLAVLVIGRWLRLFDHGTWFGIPDLVLFPKLVSLLCCFGVFAAMYSVAVKLSRHPIILTIAAGGTTALIPSFVIWTTSGLENGLFALVVVALAAVLARAAADDRLLATRTAAGAGALAALAALTRPDGIIYVLAFPLAAIITAQRDTVGRTVTATLRSLAVFAVPVTIYLGWRLATFGDYLANTARAKEQAIPSMNDLTRPALLVTYLGWLAAVLGVAVVAVVLSRPSPIRAPVAVLLVPLSLAIASYGALRADWMAQYRFATPVWPLATLIVAVSVAHLIRDLPVRGRVIAAMLAALAAAISLNGFWLWAKEFRVGPTVGVCHIALNTGYLFNGYADILRVRDGTLLAIDGGGTSLTTRLRFVDLSGLADARIARFWQTGDIPGLHDHVFNDVRPTFLKVYAPWAQGRLGLADDPRLSRDYELLWSGQAGGGEWVRRDAVPSEDALAAAHQWGRFSWDAANNAYHGAVPYGWHCADTLRPTPFSPGSPAASPLTQP
jgi:hypothetical protein